MLQILCGERFDVVTNVGRPPARILLVDVSSMFGMPLATVALHVLFYLHDSDRPRARRCHEIVLAALDVLRTDMNVIRSDIGSPNDFDKQAPFHSIRSRLARER